MKLFLKWFYIQGFFQVEDFMLRKSQSRIGTILEPLETLQDEGIMKIFLIKALNQREFSNTNSYFQEYSNANFQDVTPSLKMKKKS